MCGEFWINYKSAVEILSGYTPEKGVISPFLYGRIVVKLILLFHDLGFIEPVNFSREIVVNGAEIITVQSISI